MPGVSARPVLLWACAAATAAAFAAPASADTCPKRRCQPKDAEGNRLHYTVGAWNLQRFHENYQRKIGDKEEWRDGEDYAFIANKILELDIKILVVEEIHASKRRTKPRPGVDASSRTEFKSPELKALKKLLNANGRDYRFEVGTAPAEWHEPGVPSLYGAILYDADSVEFHGLCTFSEDAEANSGWSAKERHPYFGRFTLLDENQACCNDLVVAGVDLVHSGRSLHNVRTAITKSRERQQCIPGDEWDVLIMGAFNSDRYYSDEAFRNDVEGQEWDLLEESDGDYRHTRFDPDRFERTNRADYILTSRKTDTKDGLSGDEIGAATAVVHADLAPDSSSAETFVRLGSDHLPVTVPVAVTRDRDHDVRPSGKIYGAGAARTEPAP